jgi:hypothetical protein
VVLPIEGDSTEDQRCLAVETAATQTKSAVAD